MSENVTPLWEVKGSVLGFLPIFESYALYENRLRVRRGIVFHVEDEVLLHRVLDVKLELGLFGFGSITLYAADVTDERVTLRCIPNATLIRDQIRDAVLKVRRDFGIEGMEMAGAAHGHQGNHHLAGEQAYQQHQKQER